MKSIHSHLAKTDENAGGSGWAEVREWLQKNFNILGLFLHLDDWNEKKNAMDSFSPLNQMQTLVETVADGLGSEVFRSRRIMSGR
jgi:hypothetical protein